MEKNSILSAGLQREVFMATVAYSTCIYTTWFCSIPTIVDERIFIYSLGISLQIWLQTTFLV